MAILENGPERLQLIQQMNALLAEDCPVIFEHSKAFYAAIQPWARWTHNNPLIEGGFNKYHQVEPTERERLRAEWNEKPLWPLLLVAALLAGGVVYAIRWNQKEHV